MMKNILISLFILIGFTAICQQPVKVYVTKWDNQADYFFNLVDKPYKADLILCTGDCSSNNIQFVQNRVAADVTIKFVRRDKYNTLKVYISDKWTFIRSEDKRMFKGLFYNIPKTFSVK